jgi:hypothetical protein
MTGISKFLLIYYSRTVSCYLGIHFQGYFKGSIAYGSIIPTMALDGPAE